MMFEAFLWIISVGFQFALYYHLLTLPCLCSLLHGADTAHRAIIIRLILWCYLSSAWYQFEFGPVQLIGTNKSWQKSSVARQLVQMSVTISLNFSPDRRDLIWQIKWLKWISRRCSCVWVILAGIRFCRPVIWISTRNSHLVSITHGHLVISKMCARFFVLRRF